MRMDHEKMETDLILNKMVCLLDLLNNYVEIHEKSLKESLVEYNYKDIFNKNLMLSEFHVIDCIGKNQLPNATFIAKELDMTKGAISKISAKLLQKGLIRADRLENNKKEIYYTLTALGREAFKVHKELHEVENKKLIDIINKYRKEEKITISNFLDDLIGNLFR